MEKQCVNNQAEPLTGQTVGAGTAKNNVSSDSESNNNAVGTSAQSRVGRQEANNPVAPPEGANNLVEQIRALGYLPPKICIGTMVSGTHTVGGDQVSRMWNPGTGPVIMHMSGNMHVGGKQTIEFGTQGANGDSKGATVDAPVFKTWLESKGGCYKLEKASCALIINNIFNGKNSDPEYKRNYRAGADGDTEKLGKLFTDLKFPYVQRKENVTSDRLRATLENFRTEIKDEGYSSCFIIISSHGGEGVDSILMDDLKDVDLYKDIVYKFSDHEDVRDDPKVFLVQACRDSDGPPVGSGPERPSGLQDVLIGHSTSPRLPAARNTETGAVYFDVIDQVFRKNAENLPLASLLYEVYNHESLKRVQQYSPVELYGFRDYRFKL